MRGTEASAKMVKHADRSGSRMTTNNQLAIACGCTFVLFGEHLHTIACSTAHEEQLDHLWSQWCAERHIPYNIRTTA